MHLVLNTQVSKQGSSWKRIFKCKDDDRGQLRKKVVASSSVQNKDQLWSCGLIGATSSAKCGLVISTRASFYRKLSKHAAVVDYWLWGFLAKPRISPQALFPVKDSSTLNKAAHKLSSARRDVTWNNNWLKRSKTNYKIPSLSSKF